jgi:mycothiol synthase
VPSGYVAASARWDDLADVAALMADVDRVDFGETVFGKDFLRGQWQRPRFDLATDTLLLREAGGAVCAYAEAFDEDVPDVVEGLGVVHPDHREHGLGRALIEAQEGRAVQQATLRVAGPVRLRTATAAPDARAPELLLPRGFRRVRSFFHMEISLVDDRPAPEAPAGMAVRTFESGKDERPLYEVIQAAFRDTWNGDHASFEEWWQGQESSAFDAGLCFLALAGDEVVGAVQSSVHEGQGWVSHLAVLREHRGRGIGSFLLALAFDEFRRRGHQRVLLNVDSENETGAVGVYERAGMHVRRQWDLYEKMIQPPVGG